MKPLLLDLFCGQGGATKGYQGAGFYVVGVDIVEQPNYCGGDFILADACSVDTAWFSAIHASPPCQRYSEATPLSRRSNHPDLISPTREFLLLSGKPFVIENVECARHLLRNPIMLCGSMFGLNVHRHRYFEVNPRQDWDTPPHLHDGPPVLLTGQTRRRGLDGKRLRSNTMSEKRKASGLYWMNQKGITEAIPPAYTTWIGERLMRILT
jgi:DNA (cytosine-5)-methyltransferase 1